MPGVALALLLAAAFAHATWNYLAKDATGSIALTFAFSGFGTLAYLPIAGGVLIGTRPTLGLDALLFVCVSGALHAAYFVLLIEGYKFGDLSLVYPLARGTGPALSVLGAIILFGERPSSVALIGAALIIAGIAFMSWRPRQTSSAEIRRSVLFALATGGVIAAYTLWDNKGVTIVTPVLYSFGLEFAQLSWLAPFVLMTASGRAELTTVVRRQRRAVAGIGVLSPGAYILVLAALTIAPVSYVAPAREISILFGALLGLRLLGEADAVRRIAGALAIVAGIFALALG
ncbi:MAG: EamA family transporter [Chloroflexota bacterium]|nr:EamA family transporter [Chloroflexota bacterium]